MTSAVPVPEIDHHAEHHPDHQVARGRPSISTNATSAERIGRTGTIGIRNGLGRSGRVRRRTTTPIDTITNAINVPMLTSDPSVAIGVSPELKHMKKPASEYLRRFHYDLLTHHPKIMRD